MNQVSTLERAREVAERLRDRARHDVMGHDEVIELAIISILSGGHMLLEDHPGSGKTTLAKALGLAIDDADDADDADHADIKNLVSSSFQRVQFTPDMLPSDITGVMVFDGERNEFYFRPGPIFTHVLLVDEVNRTSPKVQSAMLEAMAERQVTVDNNTYHLDELFFVIATQNPLDSVGTYPLPVAQLDRFLFKVRMQYIDRDAELAVIDAWGMPREARELPRATRDEIIGARAVIRDQVRVDDEVKLTLLDFASHLRLDPRCQQGMSTRALVQALPALQTHAALQGRDHVNHEDLRALALPIFAHRLTLTADRFDAGELIRDALERAQPLSLEEAGERRESRLQLARERARELDVHSAVSVSDKAQLKSTALDDQRLFQQDNLISDQRRAVADYEQELIEEREDEEAGKRFFEWLERRHTPWLTWSLVIANLIIYGLMVKAGLNLIKPGAEDIMQWGGNYNPYTTTGQWWRLGSSMFIHYGLQHVAVNMVCLFYGGRVVERILGARYLLTSYLIAGVAGALASVAFNGPVVSAGASGAIFGLYGLIFGWGLKHRGVVPRSALRSLKWSAGLFVLLSFLNSAEAIDTACHLGGLIAGLMCGLAVPNHHRRTGEWRPRFTQVSGLRSALSLTVGASILTGAAAFVPAQPDVLNVIFRTQKVELTLSQKWITLTTTGGLPTAVHQAYTHLGADEERLDRKMKGLSAAGASPSARAIAEFMRDDASPTYLRHLGIVDQLITSAGDDPQLLTLKAYINKILSAYRPVLERLPEVDEGVVERAIQEVREAERFVKGERSALESKIYAKMAQLLKDEILPQWQILVRDVDEMQSQLSELPRYQVKMDRVKRYLDQRHEAWKLYEQGSRLQDQALLKRAGEAWRAAEASLKASGMKRKR